MFSMPLYSTNLEFSCTTESFSLIKVLKYLIKIYMPVVPEDEMLPDNIAACVQEGDLEGVVAWLTGGGHCDARFNAPDGSVRDSTLLMMSCGLGHEALATLLLERGASVNLQNSYGGSALQAASAEGYDGIVTKLCAAKADLTLADKNGDTALALAQKNQHAACVKALKDKAASWF